jgi:TatD DNase family protein
MTRLLDTHCHLDQYADPPAVLSEARQANIEIVAVTDNPDAYRRLRTRLGTRASDVTVALGLHPASAAAAAPGQLTRFFRMLPDASWVGEVGLDYRAGVSTADKRRQRSNFEAILNHDQIQSKVLTVHSRGAADETVSLLAQAPCRAILHWFSGSQATADRAAAQGLWFSVNPAMTRSSRGRRLIARLPPDKVLCETDGPFCPFGNRPAVPADLTAIAQAIADIWGYSTHDTTQQLALNARRLLSSA